jgi:hypothetical protein
MQGERPPSGIRARSEEERAVRRRRPAKGEAGGRGVAVGYGGGEWNVVDLAWRDVVDRVLLVVLEDRGGLWR